MTNKEAIETIKMAIEEVVWNYPMDYTVAFEEAIRALEKANKYKWHDLKENPDDLPEANRWGESNYVLVKALIKVGCYACNDMRKAYYNHTQKKWSIDGNVLAWRYIEPFKDEECAFWMNDNI